MYDREQEINRQILDNAPVSILTIRSDGVVMSENAYFRTLSETESLVGKNIFESPFFIRERLVDRYRHLFQSGDPFSANECETRDRQGKVKFIDINAVALRDAHGAVDGALSLALDSTETVLQRRRLEELNRDLEYKVRERTKELDHINKRLADALEAKSKLIADASHEIRTPLAVIQGNLELAIRLSATDPDSASTDLYRQIYDESKRIGAIIADLTLLTDTEHGRGTLVCGPVDLAQLSETVARSLGVLAGQRGITLSHSAPEPLTVWGDGPKLEKVMMNLVRNAIKYNNDHGSIAIRAVVDGNEAVVTVTDTGIGIPPEDLPHVFERFYRVGGPHARKADGSGLGLSIARWIVEAHRGTIGVESRIGQGSVFTVRLPLDHRRPQTGQTLFA